MKALRSAIRFPSAMISRRERSRRGASARLRTRVLEMLEERQLLSTFTVTSLGDSGAGTLRQAIISSNATPGPDAIDFGVAGTIRVGHKPLPSITDAVAIDGGSAPGFAGAPVVTVDFHGGKGLNFARGADGSRLSSLSLVKAGGAGVTLNASHVTVQGNYIGLLADGSTVAGNRGDGVQINKSSNGNLIGRVDPVSSISYYNSNSVSMQPVSGWQGIRQASTPGQYLIAGTSASNGLLYEGPISGVGGTSYSVNYPGATTTSVYGPDLHPDGSIALVGSYKTGAGVVNGFLFEGTTGSLGDASLYRTIDYAGAQYTYVHSVMGGLAVGNADGPEGNAPIGTGHAFLYAVEQGQFLQDVVYPGSTTTTAYGVWYNGNTSYTIAGGYSAPDSTGVIRGHGYLVDYNSATGDFSNWTSFDYPNGGVGQTFETHFEGISGVEKGGYTLSADSAQTGAGGLVRGSLVSVVRNPDGTFGRPSWVDLNDPTGVGAFSANSVTGNQVVGIANNGSGFTSVQATVNAEFQLSNVISGNRGNGIGVYGSSGNRIAMNFIGTDATGVMARGNGNNGIQLTQRASGNLIGGSATNGNDPTAGVFVRPPQGNLISGNRCDGVFINNGATQNTLSGNFIGTTASGNAALGNGMDGVAIENANGNSLIGCTFQQDPFVFYNVISGNRGNGLRITNSNDTTVQANFMGVGADNATVVANGGDGMLVSGSSNTVQNGGPIPLGGVFSGNGRNGIEVRDRASNVLSYNSFAGLFAFGGAAPNRGDGILITSSGRGNEVLTSIASGNLGNGIELGGNANGALITQVGVGTNTDIHAPLPNGLSGIKIGGHAHNNTIGGFERSIVPQVTVSSNFGYGIEVVGSARDNRIINTFVGSNFDGTQPLPNSRGGILLGPGTQRTTVGGTDPADLVKILFNGGNGLTIDTSRGNTITGNQIAKSLGFGLYARGDSRGTVVSGNVIDANASGNVDLTNSTGVIYTA